MSEPQDVRKFLDYFEAKIGQRLTGQKHLLADTKHWLEMRMILEVEFKQAIKEGIFGKEETPCGNGWDTK